MVSGCPVVPRKLRFLSWPLSSAVWVEDTPLSSPWSSSLSWAKVSPSQAGDSCGVTRFSLSCWWQGGSAPGETDKEGWTRYRRDGEPPGARCGGAPAGQAAERACQDACALTAPSLSVSDPPPWSTLRLPGSVLRRPAGSGGMPGGLGGNLHSLPFFQVWVGSSSGLPPLESLPSDLPSWDFAQPALWRSSHSVPDTAFSLSLKKPFPALENLGPAPASNALFCPAPPGYLRQGWTAPEGGRAFTQWPVG